MKKQALLFVFFSWCFLPHLHAQDKLLNLDVLFDPKLKENFNGTRPIGIQWLKDGRYYLQRDSEEFSPFVKVNALTGEKEPFLDVDLLLKAFQSQPGFSHEDAEAAVHRARPVLSPDEENLLFSYAGDLFFYEPENARLLRLTHTPERELEASFSPDGQMVAFVRDHDLFTVTVQDGAERRLTRDGTASRLNGILDWVYQEEIYGRGNFKAFWWSPDSRRLSFLQLDDSEVPTFTIVNHVPRVPTLEMTHYPKAGQSNPGVRLGIVSVLEGRIEWVDTFPYQASDFLIVNVNWHPGSRKLIYQVQNREQTFLDLNSFDVSEGSVSTLLRETTPAWVNVLAPPYWLEDGGFLWQSERDGWRHLYHFGADGKLIRQITSGQWEVRSLDSVDEKQSWIYFRGTKDSHIEEHIYRIQLDGSQLTRLSESAGTHSAEFNPQSNLYLDTFSDIETPHKVHLIRSDGSLVRVVEENKVDALDEYRLSRPEFLQVTTRDGFVMEAMMIKPPDFDPSKKYPVLSYTYSGPHAPQVSNRWKGTTLLWHQMLAQKGFIIWVCDNRTASGKGAQSVWPLYKNFGELELRDLEDGLVWLKSQPYVDGSRIGLWGWSFGGFMTSYALSHSSSFKLGIVGAPVTDWRLYDSIYTERYMGLPQQNSDGYKKSSVLQSAENMSGKILLLHGAVDDNVHLQNSIQLIDRLQKAEKQFQFMIYPESRHGVTNPFQVKHLRTLMTEFIVENL